MWEDILAMAINHGLIAAMFVGLMVFVLKDGKKRETKYQQTIEKLANALEIVEVIQETIVEVKNDIKDMKEKRR